MGAVTDSLTAVKTALATAGVGTVIREFSNATPPTTQHAVISAEPSTLERDDSSAYTGTVRVVIDWYYPGAASDGETEYLAAMDALDAIVVSLSTHLDGTCREIDPSLGFEKLSGAEDLAHWYSGSLAVTFMRREVGT